MHDVAQMCDLEARGIRRLGAQLGEAEQQRDVERGPRRRRERLDDREVRQARQELVLDAGAIEPVLRSLEPHAGQRGSCLPHRGGELGDGHRLLLGRGPGSRHDRAERGSPLDDALEVERREADVLDAGR